MTTAESENDVMLEPTPRARFTWERPEHAGCTHKQIGPVVAIRADGTKLAFCEKCNRLMDLKS